ncbi:MAG: response regulator transcription factor [Sphingomonadaceae bacterium]
MEGPQRGDSDGRVGCRGRVLVVEDDVELRSFLASCLESAGYQAIVSNNGWQGLRAVDTFHPQVAVVDLNLPVMSGFRFLYLLRRDGTGDQRRVPVIVISGDDAAQCKELVMEVKPEAYLQKPFGPDELLERVEKLLGSQE